MNVLRQYTRLRARESSIAVLAPGNLAPLISFPAKENADAQGRSGIVIISGSAPRGVLLVTGRRQYDFWGCYHCG